jgi:hypothetical protein
MAMCDKDTFRPLLIGAIIRMTNHTKHYPALTMGDHFRGAALGLPAFLSVFEGAHDLAARLLGSGNAGIAVGLVLGLAVGAVTYRVSSVGFAALRGSRPGVA